MPTPHDALALIDHDARRPFALEVARDSERFAALTG
jgi:hypothetical protein